MATINEFTMNQKPDERYNSQVVPSEINEGDLVLNIFFQLGKILQSKINIIS